MIERIWEIKGVKGTTLTIFVMLIILLVIIVFGRSTTTPVVGGGGEPDVGAIHIDSANSFYDYSIGAWIIPGSEVGAAMYRAELEGLQKLNQTGEIIFNFLPDDILCHDSDRLAKGASTRIDLFTLVKYPKRQLLEPRRWVPSAQPTLSTQLTLLFGQGTMRWRGVQLIFV